MCLVAATGLAGGCAARGAAGIARPAAEGVVLHELHASSDRAGEDTIVVYITEARVRVSHPGGDAVLDVGRGRFVLLDRAARRYRDVALKSWEASLAAAFDTVRGRQPADADTTRLGFELQGPGGIIAGFPCDRYHLFTRRVTFPGESEFVEEEIWVTRELALPEGAYRAYERALRSLEGIGFAGRIRRPPGVVLRQETHTRPESGGRQAGDEFERTHVVRVERRRIPEVVFEIPAGYAPAESAAAGP